MEFSDAIKKKRGRPKWKPTEQDRKEIRDMIGLGLTAEQVARVKGVVKSTLYEHCKDEIEVGRAYAMVKVAQTAFEMATSGKCPAMTIFWLKTQARWREDGSHLDEVEAQEEFLDPVLQALGDTAKEVWGDYQDAG